MTQRPAPVAALTTGPPVASLGPACYLGLVVRRVLGLSVVLSVTSAASPAWAELDLETVGELVEVDETKTLAALERARRIPDPRLLGTLARLSKEGTSAVRHASVAALGALGVPARTKDLELIRSALVAALKQTADARLRGAAARALARYPFPDFRQPLVELLTSGDLAEERLAREVLEAAGDATEATTRLAAYLELTRREARGERPPASEPALDAALRVASASFDRADLSPLLRDPSRGVRALLSFAQRRGPPRLRLQISEELHTRAVEEALPLLEAALADPAPEVRRAAVESSAKLEDARVGLMLAAALATEEAPAVRHALRLRLLVRSADAVALALERWPEPSAPESREVAVELLARSDSSTTTRALVRALAWPGLAGDRALEALETRPGEPALEFTIEALATSAPHSDQRRRSLSLLSGSRAPPVTAALLAHLGSGSVDEATLSALLQAPEPLVRPTVLAHLGDADPGRRARALWLAASYRGPDVTEALRAHARHGPLSPEAHALLAAQGPEAVPVWVELLEGETHARSHARVLVALRGAVDERIAPAVVTAVERDPTLYDLGLEIVRAQSARAAAAAALGLARITVAPDASRAEATRALGSIDAPERTAHLLSLADDPAVEVKMAARNTLHRLDPTKYPEWDPYGRVPLVVAGAAFGASGLMLATEIAQADLSLLFTGTVGLVLGGATPFLLTMNEDVRLGDASYFTTTGLWGTLGGYGLGLALSLDRTDALWSALLGQALGVTAGALTLRLPEWSVGDALLGNLTAAQVGLLAGSLAHAARPGTRGSTGIGLMAAAASTVPMTFLARALVAEERMGTILGATGLGAWMGPWIASAASKSQDGLTVGLGLLAGQSAGFLLGLGFAQLGELAPAQVGYAALGGLAGAAIGGGLGLLADDGRLASGLVAAGTGLGALSLGLLAEELELDRVDVLALGLLSGLGAVAGGDLMVRGHEARFDEPGFPGGLLLGAGLGLGAGLALTQLVELEPRHLTRSTLGGLLLGGAAFGLGHLLPEVDVRTRSRAIGIAAGTGLVAGGLLADRLELSDHARLHAGTLGAAGALLGGLAALYYDDSSDRSSQVGGGLLFGASAGLAVGLGLAEALGFTPRTTAASGFSVSTGSMIGAGLGLLLPRASAPEVVGLLHAFGGTGLVVGPLLESLLAERRSEDASLFAHVALPMTHGAWQGALLPWLHQSGAPSGREIGGGALFGAGLGASFGLLSYHLLDRPLEASDLVEASVFGGLFGAFGAGLHLWTDETRLSLGLGSGLALASYLTAFAVAPRTTYSAGGRAAVALGGATGAWLGANLVGLGQESPSARAVGGGVLVGASLGLAGSLLLSQWIEPEPEDVLEVGVLSAAFASVGAGLSASLDTDRQWPRSLASVSLTGGGLLAAALWAPHSRYDERSPAMITSGTLVGAWQGAWLPLLWHRAPSDGAHAGGALLGAGAGALAGTLLSQLSPRDPDDQFEVVWAAAVGSVLAGGSALLATGLDEVGTAGLVTGFGLGAYALGHVLSPYTAYSSQDRKLIALMGTLGAWHGGWLPPVWERGSADGELHGGASLLGLGFGVLGAGIAGQFAEPSDAALQLGALSWTTLTIGGGGLSLFADTDIDASSALLQGFGLSGLALGLALGDRLELGGGDPWLIALSSALGGITGATLPVLTAHGNTDRERSKGYVGGTMLGASAGALVGVGLSQALDLEPEEIARPTLATGLGAALGLGLGLMIPGSDARGRLALLDAGAVLGLGAGLAASRSEGERETAGTSLLLGSSIGAVLGASAPVLYNGPDLGAVPGEQLGGGLLFGSALGLGAGFVLDHALQPDAAERERAAAGAAMGLLAGGGLGLALSTDDRLFVGLGQGLTLLGAVGASLAPRDLEFSWPKAAAGTTYLGYLSWHSLGLSFLLDGTDRQAAGVALATVGLGSATGLYLLPELEPNLPDVLTLFAGSMWGAWIGAWSAAMARPSLDLEGRRAAGLVSLGSALGSDLGLALSALVVSRLVEVEPVRFAVINLAGLTGMVSGMITAGFLKDDPLLAGNVIGSLSGLALGALITSFIDFSKTPAWDQILGGQDDRAESTRAPSGGAPFRIHSWYPGAQILPSDEGAEQYVFSISGLWD